VRFVCTKLARRFVADNPPADVIDALVNEWRFSGGDIKQVMRTLLTHPTFFAAPPKIKRPFELLTSILRTLNANYDGNPNLIDTLNRMGHRPFGNPTPDGYPDTAEKWNGNMLGRWNLAMGAVTGELPGVSVNLNALDDASCADFDDIPEALACYGRLLLHGDLPPGDVSALSHLWESEQVGRNEMVGALLASPAFQWR
jgi:hypothetical protein